MKTYKKQMSRFRIIADKSDFKATKISSSEDAHIIIKQFYDDDIEIYESFFLLLLNRANNTIGFVKISQGGTVGRVVDPKLIAKYAIDGLASSVILAHNHPSGNTNPSEADREATKKIKEGLKLFDISVLDHIILTADSHFSFADNRIL